jgi:hypothetical protein
VEEWKEGGIEMGNALIHMLNTDFLSFWMYKVGGMNADSITSWYGYKNDALLSYI